MADAIVQTIKVQVEGTEEAAAELKKVGDAGEQAFKETEKAADQAGKSIQDFGKDAKGGLDATGGGMREMSGQAGVSSREMKALSKVMGSFGGSELAGTAFGFYRVATSLGVLGVAALAVGKAVHVAVQAFSEAKETSKALEHIGTISSDPVEGLRGLQTAFAAAGVSAKELDKTFSSLALKVAETAERAKPEWVKEWANDVDDLTNKFRNLAAGTPQAISPLADTKSLTQAFLQLLTQTAMETKTLADGTTVMALNMEKATRQAAAVYQALSPIAQLQFDQVLKGIGFSDEQIAIIHKGTAAFDEMTGKMQRLSAQNLETTATTGSFGEKLAAIGALQSDAAAGLEKIGAAGQQAAQGFKSWDQVVAESTSKFKVWDDAQGKAVDATAEVGTSAQTAATGIAGLNQQTTTTAQVFAAMATAVDTSLAQVGSAIDAIIGKMVQLQQTVAGTGLPGGGGGGGGGSGFARGGRVAGPGSGTSDSIWARLSRGEYIVPAFAVAQPGVLALLEALRRGVDFRGFAMGGFVA